MTLTSIVDIPGLCRLSERPVPIEYFVRIARPAEESLLRGLSISTNGRRPDRFRFMPTAWDGGSSIALSFSHRKPSIPRHPNLLEGPRARTHAVGRNEGPSPDVWSVVLRPKPFVELRILQVPPLYPSRRLWKVSSDHSICRMWVDVWPKPPNIRNTCVPVASSVRNKIANVCASFGVL